MHDPEWWTQEALTEANELLDNGEQLIEQVRSKVEPTPVMADDEIGGCAVRDPMIHAAGLLNTILKHVRGDPGSVKSLSAIKKTKKHCQDLLELIEEIAAADDQPHPRAVK